MRDPLNKNSSLLSMRASSHAKCTKPIVNARYFLIFIIILKLINVTIWANSELNKNN